VSWANDVFINSVESGFNFLKGEQVPQAKVDGVLRSRLIMQGKARVDSLVRHGVGLAVDCDSASDAGDADHLPT